MSDHLVLYADCPTPPAAVTGTEPLIQMADCRICQMEDSAHNLETPCACSGSLKYAHRKCVQHWCNQKGDITCEICHQPYLPGYTTPPPPCHPEETAINNGGGWTNSGPPLDLSDRRILEISDADRQSLEAENDVCLDSNASWAAFCRSSAANAVNPIAHSLHALSAKASLKILISFLLLRHSMMMITDIGGQDDDTFLSHTVLSIAFFTLRAAGFVWPLIYIMSWVISILQHQRKRQEVITLAAKEAAFVRQYWQRRGLQFSMASGPTVTPHQEPV